MSYFQTFRNNLNPERRPVKLLMSAVGEIFMVMVGILLALQVNNWNDDRKDGLKELDILREMRANLDRDLADCRAIIDGNKQFLRANQAVLKHLTDRTPFHDSLRVHYGSIWGYATLAVASGSLALVVGIAAFGAAARSIPAEG